MPGERVEIVRRSFDGWNRGDVDAWLKDAHPDAEYSSAVTRLVEGTQKVWRGTAELRRFWEEWQSVWNLEVEVTEIRELDDRVVALGQIRTRGKGSGVELQSPAAYVFEFDGHLIRRVTAFLDHTEALEVAGLSEEAMSDDQLTAVRGLLAAFSAGGEEAVRALEYLDPEADLQDHPFIDNAWHHGHEGAVEWAGKLWAVWKDPVVEVSEAVAIDDARILVRYDARAVGKLSGVPVSDGGWGIFTFRDRKILRAQSFRSKEEALEAAGLRE